jgi:hypothetical protein
VRRTVKAWGLCCRDRARVYSIRMSAKLGYPLVEPWFEIPVTITYEDGQRKRASKRKAEPSKGGEK